MSVVYSPNELANNRYPQPGGHEEAASLLIEGIGEMVPEPGIFAPVTGALIYGSVASGTAHRRSDVDFFLRVGHDSRDALEETFDYIGVLAASVEHQQGAHVQLNVHIDLPLEAGDPLVNDDPFMTATVTLAAANSPYIYGDPAKGLRRLEDLPREALLDDALRRTIGFLSIQRDRFLTHEGDLDTLEGALDLPGALGRYLLRIDHIEQDKGGYMAGDAEHKNKAEAFLLASAGADIALLHEQATRLIAMNASCTEITEAVIAGDTTSADYAAWLEDTRPRAQEYAYGLTKTAGLILALRSIDLADNS
jgi:hypothetical protein